MSAINEQLDLLAAVPTGVIREPESELVERTILDYARAHDGFIDPNEIREQLRGRVFHKVIGPTYSRLRQSGVITKAHLVISTDTIGRNAGRPIWSYRLVAA
jgi:hypothetical protein